jgi:flagellum-specific peptidoglycan hydrolase FlgJ
MTKAEFLAQASVAALQASAWSGLLAGITVAQAALESRWGVSELSRRANNYFGIKAHGKHASLEFPTTEFCGGVEQKTCARFASYESMEACFADRDRLILTSAYYAEARACAADPAKFAVSLAKHWATDPKYSGKLLAVYRSNKLYELDLTAAGK